MWILLVLIAFVLSLVAMFLRARTRAAADLGWVSERWLAERRAEQRSPHGSRLTFVHPPVV